MQAVAYVSAICLRFIEFLDGLPVALPQYAPGGPPDCGTAGGREGGAGMEQWAKSWPVRIRAVCSLSREGGVGSPLERVVSRPRLSAPKRLRRECHPKAEAALPTTLWPSPRLRSKATLCCRRDAKPEYVRRAHGFPCRVRYGDPDSNGALTTVWEPSRLIDLINAETLRE